MAHVVGRRILTAKTRFDTRSAPVRDGVHKMTRGRFFCKHIGFISSVLIFHVFYHWIKEQMNNKHSFLLGRAAVYRGRYVLYRLFKGTCCIIRRGRPDDADSRFLWNYGTYLPDNSSPPRNQYIYSHRRDKLKGEISNNLREPN